MSLLKNLTLISLNNNSKTQIISQQNIYITGNIQSLNQISRTNKVFNAQERYSKSFWL